MTARDTFDDPRTEYRRRATRDRAVIAALRDALHAADRRIARMRRTTWLACLGLGCVVAYHVGRFVTDVLTGRGWWRV